MAEGRPSRRYLDRKGNLVSRDEALDPIPRHIQFQFDHDPTVHGDFLELAGPGSHDLEINTPKAAATALSGADALTIVDAVLDDYRDHVNTKFWKNEIWTGLSLTLNPPPRKKDGTPPTAEEIRKRSTTSLVAAPAQEYEGVPGVQTLELGGFKVKTTKEFRRQLNTYFSEHFAKRGFASPLRLVEFFGMSDGCTAVTTAVLAVIEHLQNAGRAVPFKLAGHAPGIVASVSRRATVRTNPLVISSYIKGITDAKTRGADVRLALMKGDAASPSGFRKHVLDDSYAAVLAQVRACTEEELVRSLEAYGEPAPRHQLPPLRQRLMKCCSASAHAPQEHRIYKVLNQKGHEPRVFECPANWMSHNTLLIELTDGRCYEFDPTWQQMEPMRVRTPLGGHKAQLLSYAPTRAQWLEDHATRPTAAAFSDM